LNLSAICDIIVAVKPNRFYNKVCWENSNNTKRICWYFEVANFKWRITVAKFRNIRCKIKTSQAMLRGSKIRPQCFGNYFNGSSTFNGESCAIGAAYEGVTGIWNEQHYEIWQVVKNETEMTNIEDFYCLQMHAKTSLHGAITYMNDKLNWKREKIARWVAKNVEHQNSLANPQVKHVWSRLLWDIRNNGGYTIDLEYSYRVDNWFEIVARNNVNHK